MRKYLFWFLFIPVILRAQVSMDDFLWSAFNTPSVQAFDNQDDFLAKNPYRLAPVRAMEFRTESNQLDPERQDYALRLKVANPWEVKRNNHYFQVYREVLQLDRQRELKKVLETHYEAIINWAYLNEEKKIMQEEQDLAQTLIKILEAQRFSDFFDAKDYTELKIDQIEQVMALEAFYFEQDAQRSKIESLYPEAQNQTIRWSFGELISIDEILETLESKQRDTKFTEVVFRQKQVELAQSEWALEKSNINIGFLQAQYQQYRIEQDRSPWSIGLGINIPIFNPNKGNMTKRKLELMEAEGELSKELNEQKSGLLLKKNKAHKLALRYYALQNQLTSLSVDSLASNLQRIEGSNPITTVKLKRSLIKSKRIAMLLRKEIYLAFIEYLAYAEKLQQQPFKNHLWAD